MMFSMRGWKQLRENSRSKVGGAPRIQREGNVGSGCSMHESYPAMDRRLPADECEPRMTHHEDGLRSREMTHCRFGAPELTTNGRDTNPTRLQMHLAGPTFEMALHTAAEFSGLRVARRAVHSRGWEADYSGWRRGECPKKWVESPFRTGASDSINIRTSS